jgi:hypothetical protein
VFIPNSNRPLADGLIGGNYNGEEFLTAIATNRVIGPGAAN